MDGVGGPPSVAAVAKRGVGGPAQVPAMDLMMMFDQGGTATAQRAGTEITAAGFNDTMHRNISHGCHYFENSNSMGSQFTAKNMEIHTKIASQQMDVSNPEQRIQYNNSVPYSAFPSETGNVVPNFSGNLYPESVRQCPPSNIPGIPYYTLFPSPLAAPYMNIFNEGQLDLERANEQGFNFLDAPENMRFSNLLMFFPASQRKFAAQEFASNMARDAFLLNERNASNTRCITGEPSINRYIEEYDPESRYHGFVVVLQKELSNSDVGNVGRIVLPKREAEANLPPLHERDGIVIYMNDMVLQTTWKFKYRFWPNNKSRMYILESTGDFVKAHRLHTGDLFTIYKNVDSGEYIVRGRKGGRPPTYEMVR